jgi:diguanylate cyclase (GGDEF)-like protein
MKWPKWLVLLIPLVLVVGNSRTATANGILVFLGNENIPPMIYVQKNQVVGLVVDIAHQMAQEASLTIEVRAMDWTKAQELVRDGKADALLQINRNPEREAIYDFSDPLLESYFTIFRRNDRVDIREINSLYGKLVGVEASGYPFTLVKKYPEINVQIIDSWKSGFNLVNAGSLDAVIVDRWVGEYELAVNNINGITVVPEPVETNYSYIAVKKGNKPLLDQINLGLSKMRADGSIDRILNSWSGKEVVYLSIEQIKYYYLAGISAIVILVLLIILLLYARALARAKHRAELLAITDDLTQLHNRRFYFLAGERELAVARRHKRPLAVMRLDVDKFKAINDQWGHAIGDEVLITIARTIKTSVRIGDICSRLGGDEFAAILPETNANQAMLIAERTRNVLAAQMIQSGNDAIRFTVSIGVAIADQNWATLEDLLILSDKALYQAKESGRSQVVVFSPNDLINHPES